MEVLASFVVYLDIKNEQRLNRSLPKAKKPYHFLRSWHPVSLLNTSSAVNANGTIPILPATLDGNQKIDTLGRDNAQGYWTQANSVYSLSKVWLNRESLMAIYHVSPLADADIDKMVQNVPCLHNWHGQRCNRNGFSDKKILLSDAPENNTLSNDVLHYMMSQIELGSVFSDDAVAKTTKANNGPSYYKHRHSSTDYRVGCTRYSGSQIVVCSAREWTLDAQTETIRPKLNTSCKCPLPATGAENAHGDRLFVVIKSRRISLYDNKKSSFVTLGYLPRTLAYSLLAFDAEDCVLVTYKHGGDEDYEEDSGPEMNSIHLFCLDGTKPRQLVSGTFCGMYYDRYTNFLYYIQQVKGRFELMSLNVAGDEPILIATLNECQCPRDLQLVAGDPVSKVIVWVSSYNMGTSKVSYAQYSRSKPVTPALLHEVKGELRQVSITGDLLLWIDYADNALRSFHLISKTVKYVTKCPGHLLYEKPFTNTYNKTFTFTCVEKVKYQYHSRMTMYDMQGVEVATVVLRCRDPIYVG